jgi:GAF domain-containing protein
MRANGPSGFGPDPNADSEWALQLVLEDARVITGARYAALGVLDDEGLELQRFLISGVDAAMRRAIGQPPRGRGVLGVLISDPQPLRLVDVSRHPDSYGFPAGHPPMRSFLGVPIMIGGRAWGNLYLAEKQGGGGFTEADEEAAVRLAQLAANAIESRRA